MHEISIAGGIIDIALDHARKHNAGQVKEIWIERIKMREIMHKVIYYTHMVPGIVACKFDPFTGKDVVIRKDNAEYKSNYKTEDN